MDTFGKEAEEQLLKCAREVQAYIVDGDSPDDAIIKVAREYRVHPDTLPLLVQATNVGRQGYQREKCSGQGILSQVAEFPLARIENVKAALYPQQPTAPAKVLQASAVSPEYRQAPRPVLSCQSAAEKAASADLPASWTKATAPGYQGDPKLKVARAQAAKQKVAAEIDQANMLVLSTQTTLLRELQTVVNYFKQAADNRLPLAEVEWNARRLFGDVAMDIFNHVGTTTKEARASQPPRTARPVLASQAPYCYVERTIKAAEAHLAAKRSLQTLEGAASEKIAQIMRPFADSFPQPPMSPLGRPAQDFSGRAKVGSFFSPLAAGLGASIGSGMRVATQPKGTPDMVNDIALELDDPQHNDELKGIEARAMLNDLLANDEVVSGFDPQEVAEAYNEITQLAPSSATQPALMRPLLRKRLTAGAVEPFEAQQMADIEKTVRQTQQVGRQTAGGQNVSSVLG